MPLSVRFFYRSFSCFEFLTGILGLKFFLLVLIVVLGIAHLVIFNKPNLSLAANFVDGVTEFIDRVQFLIFTCLFNSSHFATEVFLLGFVGCVLCH